MPTPNISPHIGVEHVYDTVPADRLLAKPERLLASVLSDIDRAEAAGSLTAAQAENERRLALADAATEIRTELHEAG